jgi:apolipoprotein N-acyltransferase
MRLGPALAATLLSAALYALAFPPFALRGLAWVALAPLLIAVRDATLRRRLGLGVLWSFAAGGALGTWMPRAVAEYFDQSLAVGFGLWALVTGLMAAPYYALFAVLAAPLLRPGAAAPLLVGAAWAGAELLRGRLLNGGLVYVGSSPWGTFGASQVGADVVVQVASLGGVYAISFVLACANAAVADALVSLGGRTRVSRAGLLGAGGVVAAALGFGAWSLRAAPLGPPAQAVPVALVQADLPAALRWEPGGPVRTLEAYARLTREALAAGRPRIAFWPEAALTFFLEREPAHRRALERLAAEGDVELVVGAPRAEGPEGTAPYRNSVYAVDPASGVAGRYDKQRLLPFMESFPVGVDLLRRRFGRIREFSPGASAAPLATRAGPAGVLVCNEALLPHLAAERMDAGAAYLLNPSNDSWVRDVGFAEHQFQLVALRALEQRTHLVRVSDSGPSGVVDPWGRVLARSDPGARAVVQAPLAPGGARSLYGRVGDAFGMACLAAALFAARRSPRPPGVRVATR